jgi:DNA-binding transcriptional regulator YiaG
MATRIRLWQKQVVANIIEIREVMGLTQAQFAPLICITPNRVSEMETLKRPPTRKDRAMVEALMILIKNGGIEDYLESVKRWKW